MVVCLPAICFQGCQYLTCARVHS
uniref:Uncharacterized protein n=1 Tax=Anguilla anguilla TaxID=7936 RepID=A0A0E9RAK0_ANGAN